MARKKHDPSPFTTTHEHPARTLFARLEPNLLRENCAAFWLQNALTRELAQKDDKVDKRILQNIARAVLGVLLVILVAPSTLPVAGCAQNISPEDQKK